MKTNHLHYAFILIFAGILSCGDAPRTSPDATLASVQMDTPVFKPRVGLNLLMDSLSILNKLKKIDEHATFEIPHAQACEMVGAYGSASNIAIASSWLFERRHIEALLDSCGASVSVAGVRFYPAKTDTLLYSVASLTWIAIPVVNVGGKYNDHAGCRLYEFAQMCPPYCKDGTQGEVITTQARPDIMIPNSLMILRKDLKATFVDATVKFLKLERTIGADSTVNFNIVGTDKDLNHNHVGPVLTGRTQTCQNCNLCP